MPPKSQAGPLADIPVFSADEHLRALLPDLQRQWESVATVLSKIASLVVNGERLLGGHQSVTYAEFMKAYSTMQSFTQVISKAASSRMSIPGVAAHGGHAGGAAAQQTGDMSLGRLFQACMFSWWLRSLLSSWLAASAFAGDGAASKDDGDGAGATNGSAGALCNGGLYPSSPMALLSLLWQRFLTVTKIARQIVEYIDRYATHAKIIQPIELAAFRETIFVVLQEEASMEFLQNVERERMGETVQREAMESMKVLFAEIDSSAIDLRTMSVSLMSKSELKTYVRYIQEPLLAATTAFYKDRAARWLSENSVSDYLRIVADAIEQEENRGNHYLTAETKKEVIRLTQAQLVTAYMSAIVSHPTSGFAALLENFALPDLALMFDILSRLKDAAAVGSLTPTFRAHLERQSQELKSRSSDAASPTAFIINTIQFYQKYKSLCDVQFKKSSVFLTEFRHVLTELMNQKFKEMMPSELLAVFTDSLVGSGNGTAGDLLLSKDADDGGAAGSGRSMSIAGDAAAVSYPAPGTASHAGDSHSGASAVSDFDRVLDHIVALLGFITNKDLFGQYFQQLLAKRLLHAASGSHFQDLIDLETTFVSKLKLSMGGGFTSRMESMIADKQLSKEYDPMFLDYLSRNGAVLPFAFSCQVLRSGCWPRLDLLPMTLPVEVGRACALFEQFYKAARPRTKLSLVHSHGEVILVGRFPKCGEREIAMRPDQAVLCLLLNESDCWSMEEAVSRTGLDEETVRRQVASMARGRWKIMVEEKDRDSGDRVVRFRFAEGFVAKERKFNLPIAKTRTERQEREQAQADTDENRKFVIRARLVAIMKARKTLHFNDLIGEVVAQTASLFKPDVRFMKTQVEYLIEQEYLKRSSHDTHLLEYS